MTSTLVDKHPSTKNVFSSPSLALPQVQQLFRLEYGEVFHVQVPTSRERRNFFEDLILNQAAKAPASKKKAGERSINLVTNCKSRPNPESCFVFCGGFYTSYTEGFVTHAKGSMCVQGMSRNITNYLKTSILSFGNICGWILLHFCFGLLLKK